MKVILGLGNPGLRYRSSRHNLGFLVVGNLARGNRIKLKLKAFDSLLGKGKIGPEQVWLGLPLTFMSLSGRAVAAIVKDSEIALSDLLVVCDDVNLSLGRIRLRARGSAGGHNGLTSIIESLGSEEFTRLRIGVGRPQGAIAQSSLLTRHVLGRFNKKEIKVIDQAVEEAVQAALVWAKAGTAAAMNQFN